MEGYVVEARVCSKRKTYVKPIAHDYSDKRNPNYFKYSCPVCDSLGNSHQVGKYEKNCPLCNVNLYWAESEEADKEEEEVIEDEADVTKPAKTEREGDNNDSENSTDFEGREGSEAVAESDC